MMHDMNRRRFLKGVGAAVALPWMESLATAQAAPGFPRRMAMLYVPNGKNMADWTPKTVGADFELPAILKPLEPHRKDILVLTGLTADGARAHGDGGGDHARALASFLTGAHPKKTDGTDIRNGVSVDQVAAAAVGDKTRLPSLEIGCESGAMAGNCDSGYSCVYSSTMSWRTSTQPLPKEVNPKLVFERLFGSGSAADRAKVRAQRKSVLDLVREDSREIEAKLSKGDRRKLEEYMTSVRDVEVRMDRAATLPEVKPPQGAVAPAGIPATYDEHLKIMGDLMALAFQADITRVCTFVLANEGSNKPYPFIGVPEGHHDLSHHGNNPDKKAKIARINTFHVQQFAYLLERLKSIREGDGTLLDNCMIGYGSANSDGNRHNHEDLPVVVAGRGGGTIQTGRHLKFPNETPITNLWLAFLQRMDVKAASLGDSNGPLPI
jgi:hypothetical protein